MGILVCSASVYTAERVKNFAVVSGVHCSLILPVAVIFCAQLHLNELIGLSDVFRNVGIHILPEIS